MTELLVPVLLCLATLAFVLSPLLFPASGRAGAPAGARERWLTLAQLDLDRDLGKIDQAEYDELKERAAADPVLLSPVESVIYFYRQARRRDRSIEAEILVARARKQRQRAGQAPASTDPGTTPAGGQ